MLEMEGCIQLFVLLSETNTLTATLLPAHFTQLFSVTFNVHLGRPMPSVCHYPHLYCGYKCRHGDMMAVFVTLPLLTRSR